MAEDTATETEIEPERVRELAESGAQLIDVRRPSEWESGRIEGARHIEINDVAGQAESISRDVPVVFYCRSGNRSALVAAAFRGDGWEAYNLAGGITEWVERGLPLDPPDGQVAPSRPGI